MTVAKGPLLALNGEFESFASHQSLQREVSPFSVICVPIDAVTLIYPRGPSSSCASI